MCCSDRKFVALSAPRGHAKSTAITFAFTLAAVLFRERRFVLLVSDTETQAALFLGNIKRELADNEDLRTLFGVDGFDKESETDIIIRFREGASARIMAKGSEQKLRGLNWNGTRPDLIIGDDMENDEIVLNKERRAKFKRWFTSALLPSLAKNGIIRLIGTILHMDSLLEGFMPKTWKKDEVGEITNLKVTSSLKNIWLSAKYRAHPSMDDFSEVLWPDYKPAKWLRAEQQVFKQDGHGDAWAQEMLNEPLDDSNALFKKSDFDEIQPADLEKPVNYYIAMDLATTKDNNKRDYSAFVIGAVDENLQLQVRYVIKQRMDALEIVDKIIELQRIFSPLGFIVEKGLITNSILPFLRVKMLEEQVYPLVNMLANTTDKVQNTFSIRGRMRAGFVKFQKDADWYPGLEQECIRFPRDRHDDQVDALSLLGRALDKFIYAPSQEELVEEEYQREKDESEELGDTGASVYTGY